MGRGREGTLERGWEQGRCAGKAGWCGGKGGRKQLLGPRAPRLARVQLRGGFHGTSQLLLPLAAPKAVIKCAGRPTITGGPLLGGSGGALGPCSCLAQPAKGAVLCCLCCPQSKDGIGILPWPRAGQGSVSLCPQAEQGSNLPMLQTGQGSMSL